MGAGARARGGSGASTPRLCKSFSMSRLSSAAKFLDRRSTVGTATGAGAGSVRASAACAVGSKAEGAGAESASASAVGTADDEGASPVSSLHLAECTFTPLESCSPRVHCEQQTQVNAPTGKPLPCRNRTGGGGGGGRGWLSGGGLARGESQRFPTDALDGHAGSRRHYR